MKKMLIILLLILLLPLLYVAGNLLLAVFTKFHPAPIEDVADIGNNKTIVLDDSTYSFLIWNIGYGGLGAETDFFYDDGKMVITPKEWVEKYTRNIFDSLHSLNNIDFVLLQEVDRKGKRSHNIDEVAGIAAQLPNHNYAFAVNYDVVNLPFPWTEPLGRIYGGLLSLSSFKPIESKRYALSGITDFPRKLFYLERCLLVQRFRLKNGKDLLVINTHFEAYDDGGIKKQQMAQAKKLMLEEFAKGNYVVMGGDWNIAPPNFDIKKWEKTPVTDTLYKLQNDPNYIAGWKYAFDGNVPTNRKNDKPLNDSTYKTVIDYFLVSPNIDVTATEGLDYGFANSDHNPVKMTIRLK